MKKPYFYILPALLCGCLSMPVFAEQNPSLSATVQEEASAGAATSDDSASGETTAIEEGDNIKDVSEQTGDRTGVVTFVMDVPSDVSDPCVVLFTEVDSYDEYYAEAFKSADYTVTAYLKPGAYMVTDGYPIGDNVSAYSVQDKGYFVVEEGGQQEVDITIRSKGDVIREAANKEELQAASEASTEEENAPAEVQPQKDMRKYYDIAAVVLLTLGTLFMVVLYKVLKKQRK